jgi:hypothetical protein
LTRPVRLSALAAQDLQQARDWFDAREAGMGDKFLNSVEDALDRISRNAEQYQIALLDLRRAPVRPFNYSLSLSAMRADLGPAACRRGSRVAAMLLRPPGKRREDFDVRRVSRANTLCNHHRRHGRRSRWRHLQE